MKNAINYIPSNLKDKDFYKIYCEMLDYIGDKYFNDHIDTVKGLYDVNSPYFDPEYMFRLLGSVEGLFDEKTTEQKKAITLFLSNLSSIKGTRTAISYILKLLNLDAEIFSWFEVNYLNDIGDPEFPVTVDPCSIIIDISTNQSYSDDLISRIETLLQELLWVCVIISEIRWKKKVEESLAADEEYTFALDINKEESITLTEDSEEYLFLLSNIVDEDFNVVESFCFKNADTGDVYVGGGVPDPVYNLAGEFFPAEFIKLTWTDDNEYIGSYFIYRRILGDLNWDLLANISSSAPEYEDYSVVRNTTYEYSVEVSNSCGLSINNPIIEVICPIELDPPINLIATYNATTHKIDVEWTDQSTGEFGFKLERSLNETYGFSLIQTLGENVTTFEDADIQLETRYYYRVYAYGLGAISQFSNVDDAQVPGIPTVPINLVGVYNYLTGHNDLTWDDTTNWEDGFILQRKVEDGSFVQIADLPPNTEDYEDTDVTLDTLYTYRIKAYNHLGESLWSNEAQIQTPKLSPINLVAELVIDCFYRNMKTALSWTDTSTIETGFVIERKKGTGSWGIIGTTSANVTVFDDYDLELESEYTYRVYATHPIYGNSNTTNEETITTPSREFYLLAAYDKMNSYQGSSYIDETGMNTAGGVGIAFVDDPTSINGCQRPSTSYIANSNFSFGNACKRYDLVRYVPRTFEFRFKFTTGGGVVCWGATWDYTSRPVTMQFYVSGTDIFWYVYIKENVASSRWTISDAYYGYGEGLAIDTWHHAAIVVDTNDQVLIYVNGALLTTRYWANFRGKQIGTAGRTSKYLYGFNVAGSYSYVSINANRTYVGHINNYVDEFRIWEEARTANLINEYIDVELDDPGNTYVRPLGPSNLLIDNDSDVSNHLFTWINAPGNTSNILIEKDEGVLHTTSTRTWTTVETVSSATNSYSLPKTGSATGFIRISYVDYPDAPIIYAQYKGTDIYTEYLIF